MLAIRSGTSAWRVYAVVLGVKGMKMGWLFMDFKVVVIEMAGSPVNGQAIIATFASARVDHTAAIHEITALGIGVGHLSFCYWERFMPRPLRIS